MGNNECRHSPFQVLYGMGGPDATPEAEDVVKVKPKQSSQSAAELMRQLREDGPPFLVSEASLVTRVGVSKLYDLIGSGVLPAIRLPSCNKILIAREDLRNFLAAGWTGAATA
jgi:excisionase family DNA binding protein